MFESDYTINGIHATYLKYLYEAKIFKRYIDVYMNAAIIGFLYGRLGKKDNSSQDRARIYADAFATERLKCDFIYRLIMLLDEGDESTELSVSQRLDRAFRYDSLSKDDSSQNSHSQNMDRFNSYVLGGIEVLYEKFTSGITSRDDYINRIFDVVSKFKEEVEGKDFENKLKKLICSN